MPKTKHHAVQADSIYDLEDKLNEFAKTNKILFTQPFQTKEGYDCMIGYEAKEIEDIRPASETKSSNKPTASQKWYIKEHTVGDIDPNMTFHEADKIISELKAKENKK